MDRFRHERAFALLLLVFAVCGVAFVIPHHTGDGFGGEGSLPASFMPTLAATGIALLLAARLAGGLIRRAPVQMARNPFAGRRVGHAAACAAALAAAVSGAVAFGVLAVTPVLAVSVMAILGERRWQALLAMAVAVPVALHLAFERLLGASL
jgi:hypothetical protein